MRASVRLPFGALDAAFGKPSVAELARRLDVNYRTVLRWKHQGVPAASGELVVRGGMHPADVWGARWYPAAKALDLCRRGHVLDETNGYVRPNGQRWCLICQRASRV